MKTSRLVTTLACTTALFLILAACSGTTATSNDASRSAATQTTQEAPVAYTPETFSLDSFDVKITKAEVKWDEDEALDALVFTLKVSNSGDEGYAWGSVLNIADTHQGDSDLYWAFGLAEVDDSYTSYAAAGSGEELQPGESASYTYAFLLEGYDNPVIVNFQGYTSGVKGGAEVTFDVSKCKSKEAKEVEQAAKDEASTKQEEVKNGTKSAEVPGAAIELPDDWHFPYVSSYSLTAENADGARLYIVTDSLKKDAGAWAEEMAAKFSSHSLEDTTIAGKKAKILKITDTAWYAWIDTAEGAVEFDASDLTFDDAQTLFDSMTFA